MTVVISLHDVAPATHAESVHLLDQVEQIGARASLLVIPGPWREPHLTDDAAFVRWLDAARSRGHEIVAHGWEHRAVTDPTWRPVAVRRIAERLLTRGCAEFAALGQAESVERAQRSMQTLHSIGLRPTGFVAPGWSMSPAVPQALLAARFDYTVTRLGVVDLRTSRTLPIPAVCHRPDSPLSASAARMVAAVVRDRCRSGRSIRLALHPADVHDDRLDRANDQALGAIGSSRHTVMTYADLVESCRADPRAGFAADVPRGPVVGTEFDLIGRSG